MDSRVRRWGVPAAVLLLAVVVWQLWSSGGRRPGLTPEALAWGASEYEPYAWWMTHRTGGYTRAYPTEVGPSVLPQPLAEQDGALSTRGGDS